MKFSCTKENLVQTLSIVSGVAGKNANLPILGNVLIKAEEQKVEITATNLEAAAIVNLRAKIELSGSFTAPARTLLDYVGLLTGERMDIELVENELLVKCGRSSTKIKGAPADDFPIIPLISEGRGFLLLAEDVKKGLSQVLPSVARTDIRAELSGVYFGFNTENNNGLLTMAATDSYRLAEKKIKIIQGADSLKMIVPGRTIQEIIRALSLSEADDGGEKNVRLLVSENQIAVSYGNTRLVSRLVDGQYPDYAQIIPKDFKTTAEFDTDAMVKEIKAAALFSTSGVNAVSVDLNTGQGSIGVSSTSTQTGEHSSEVEAEIQGEENSVLLNHRYLLDGLSGLNTPRAVLKVVSADSPCVLSPKGDESFLYIIMPVRQ